MEPDRVLAAFDAEVRRSVRPDGSGARIEADPLVVRWVGADGRGWSGIAWSGLRLGFPPRRRSHGGLAHGACLARGAGYTSPSAGVG